MTATVGFLGIGSMGKPMSQHILDLGYSLVVFDPNEKAMQPLLDGGATRGASPKDVADKAEIVFICLPRIYEGNHHPTDLLAGLAGGAFITWTLTRPFVLERVAEPLHRLVKRYPGPAFAAFFFLTFQIATLFDGGREVASYLAGVVRNIAHRL